VTLRRATVGFHALLHLVEGGPPAFPLPEIRLASSHRTLSSSNLHDPEESPGFFEMNTRDSSYVEVESSHAMLVIAKVGVVI